MKRPPLFRSLSGFTFLLGAFALCAATRVGTAQQASFPEIFVVNSTGNGDDAFPGDGQCETAVGNGVCTLRAAIEEANAHAGSDGIFFSIPTSDPGYSNGRWTIGLTKALPNVADSVNITGPGANQLSVWNPTGNQFPTFNVTATGTVNISNLTIGGQDAFGNTSSGSGIQNSSTGTVNVTSCTIVDNIVSSTTSSPRGGGINNNSGMVQVTNSTLSLNRADSPLPSLGGGIYNNTGTVSVANSTLSDNSAYVGGGIDNENGVVNVIGSTSTITAQSVEGVSAAVAAR